MIMSLLDKLKGLFRKKEENTAMTASELFKADEEKVITRESTKCKDCIYRDFCLNRGTLMTEENCELEKELKKINPDKKSILLIDDNAGLISFLYDDMEYLSEIGVFNINDYNIIKLSSQYAAFHLEAMMNKKDLNIHKAIIDITLGGTIKTEEGTIKYTGIDVYEMLIKANPKLQFIFYTGNNLNPYIKSNKKLIEQFQSISGEDINKHILFKTSLDMDARRKVIAKRFFDTEI